MCKQLLSLIKSKYIIGMIYRLKSEVAAADVLYRIVCHNPFFNGVIIDTIDKALDIIELLSCQLSVLCPLPEHTDKVFGC